MCIGQPKDKEGDVECERAKKKEKRGKWKRRLGENKCNMDKRALLIGLWTHRFQCIIGSKRE